MADGTEKKSFWETLPGIITALAALVGALAGLLTAYTKYIEGGRPTPNANIENSLKLPPRSPSDPIASVWAYYEVGRKGELTDDGQLAVLPPGTPLPDFTAIKRGTLLRAKSAINVRSAPPKDAGDLKAKPLATLAGGTCLIVVSDADKDDQADVKQARSGGWLEVDTKACPRTD